MENFKFIAESSKDFVTFLLNMQQFSDLGFFFPLIQLGFLVLLLSFVMQTSYPLCVYQISISFAIQ